MLNKGLWLTPQPFDDERTTCVRFRSLRLFALVGMTAVMIGAASTSSRTAGKERGVAIDARGRSGYIEANGIRQHYLEYGSGSRTIVVVPGITSPAITWDFVAQELAADFRVLTIDVRG